MLKLLTLMLLPMLACAQQFLIRGRIIDTASGEPVIAATIAIKGSYMGAISNDEGMFQLSASKGKVVAISSIGYKSIELPAESFDSALTDIRLEPDNQILEEVIVTGMTVEELLKKIIATSEARFNKPILLSTYYREFSRLNDKTTKFSDGIIDYYVSGRGKTSTDLIVRQSRAARISTPEDDFDPDTFMHLQKRISSNYEHSFLKKAFLRGNRYLYYDMIIKSRKGHDGKELYVIVIEPKAEASESLYQGSISFDPELNLIYGLDIKLAESHIKYAKTLSILGYKFKLLDQKVHSTYALVNNHYYLLHNTAEGAVSIFNKRRGLDEKMAAKSSLVTINFARDAPGYDKASVYRGKNLYARGNQYSEDFWKKGGSIIMTPEEEEIVKSIRTEAAAQEPKP